MTIISQKKEEILAELQTVVDQHNNLLEQKNAAYQRFVELQGSLKTLNELEESEDGREDS